MKYKKKPSIVVLSRASLLFVFLEQERHYFAVARENVFACPWSYTLGFHPMLMNNEKTQTIAPVNQVSRLEPPLAVSPFHPGSVSFTYKFDDESYVALRQNGCAVDKDKMT